MIVKRMQALGEKRSVIREIFEYGKARKAEIGEENVFDFSLGNPSVPAPECVTEALRTLLSTRDAVSLHGYTSAPGDASVRGAIADYLNENYSVGCTANDLYMTVGAAASLSATLSAVAGAGEEVIAFAPFFPEYRVFTEQTGATLRVVPFDEETLGISFEALDEALSERTAAVIINSPNNPSGVILPEETLKRLGEVLRKKSEEIGHVIYLIADEPYRGRAVPRACLRRRCRSLCHPLLCEHRRLLLLLKVALPTGRAHRIRSRFPECRGKGCALRRHRRRGTLSRLRLCAQPFPAPHSARAG